MNTQNNIAISTKSELQIDTHINYMSALIQTIHEYIGQLEERLSRVLVPINTKEEKSISDQELVPLAAQMADICRDIKIANDRLISIMNRLQL